MFTGRWLLGGWLVLITSVAWINSGLGQTISTTAPPLYQKKLAGQLTPLEDVLKNLPPPPKEAEDGWVLLDEELHLAQPDGSVMRVTHSISKALTDAGAEGTGRSTRGYRKSTTKAHLVLARTILPDGTRKPVNPKACFLQTPQRDADAEIYGDHEEMVIIFPNVKAGSIVESIVVYEESHLRIPGHYTAVFGFEAWWPMLQTRCVVEMPKEWAARLRITPLGQNVPEATKTSTDDGGQRWTWVRKNISGSQEEPAGAPFVQTGPLVFLTTLKDWPEFLHWYVPLAEKTAKLSPKFAAEVDSLTKSAQNPRQILDILHRAVANEVRYVGLEFGDSDIEPHPVSEIWEHKYGDCKDKASLLCAMLRHKGIKAHMLLINTEHLGRVERRSPDYRHFNHAILVAELADGPIFCDPTIEGSSPGMLAPSDSDRDVLLVAEPERWMRTPKQDAGRYALNFDAEISPNGEISGWATLEADGYIASLYQNWEAKSTAQQIKERLSKRLANCYPGSRVIDVKTVPHPDRGDYQLRVYFIVPAGGSLTVRFPFETGFLPDLGTEERKRLTDASLWIQRMENHSTFKLPAGFHAAELPANFSAKNDHCAASAGWQLEKGLLKTTLNYETKSSRLPAAEANPFKQAIASLRSWLDKPVTLVAGDDAAPAAPADDLAGFTQMPSGSGQLELVNQRYPSNGNLKLRRAALEKTLAWFPKDAATQLAAHTQLAFADTLEKKHAAGIVRLRTQLQALRGKVTAEQAAMADYMLAICLKNQGSNDEALTIQDSIAANDQLSAFRRSWAQFQRSVLLADKDAKRALQAAQAGMALDDADIPVLFQQISLLRLQAGQKKELSSDLTNYLAKDAAESADVMTALAEQAEEWTTAKPELAPLLVAVLEQAGDAKRFGKAYAETLMRAKQESRTYGSLAGIQKQLKEWLAAHPKDLPQGKAAVTAKTPEDFNAAIAKLLEKPERDPAGLVQLAVESLVRFEPSGWFGERLWRAATYADYLDRQDGIAAPPAILLELLDLCDLTPPLTTPHTEGRFLRVTLFNREKKLDSAFKVLEGLVNTPDLDRGYYATASERYADNCLARGDAAAALKVWHKLDGMLTFNNTPTELLRAILTALENNKREEALAFLKILRRCDKSTIAKTNAADHVESFMAFAKDDQTAIAWWDAADKWWPAWLECERQCGGVKLLETPPVIASLEELGRAFGAAGRDNRKSEALAILRTIAHAARWQPSMAVELAELLPSLSKVNLGAWSPHFRSFIIALFDASSPMDANLRERLMIWATAAMIDSGKSRQALVPLRDFYHRSQASHHAVPNVVLRLWTLAAIEQNQDLPEVTAALVKALAEQKGYSDRHQDVSSLASLYQKQDRARDEANLWEKELASEENLGRDAPLDAMRQRLEVLRDGAAAGDGPALAAKAWLSAKTPSWLDFVRPHNLKDEKIGNPDDVINNGGGLLTAEAVKLCLLTAQTTDQPDERRFNAIASLAWNTAAIAGTLEEAKAWINALINEKSLPRRVRAAALSSFLRNAFVMDQKGAIQAFCENPLLGSLDPEQAAFLRTVRSYANLKTDDLDAAFKLASNLMDEQVDYFAVETVQRCVVQLASSGDVERARKLYQGLGKARFIERLARDRAAHQLNALKAINAIQKHQPVHDALRALFLKSFPNAVKNTPAVETYHRSSVNLSEEDALSLYLQRLQRGDWEHADLSFWTQLIEALPKNEASTAFSLAALSLVIEKGPDDASRASFIQYAPSFVDIDDAEIRRRLDAVLQPGRTLADSPKTQDALRVHDLLVKLRIGAEVDLFASIAAVQDDRFRSRARWNVMKACLARRDAAGLSRLMDSMNANELLSPANITSTLKAYRFLKKTDEAELAMNRLKEILYEDLVTAWTYPNGDNALRAQSFATQLDEPSLLPADFARSLAGAIKNHRTRILFQANDELLHKRWAECVKLAAEGVRVYPNFYDFVGLLGFAQTELGQKEEAIKNLNTFLTYTHNDPQAEKAKEYLKKAGG